MSPFIRSLAAGAACLPLIASAAMPDAVDSDGTTVTAPAYRSALTDYYRAPASAAAPGKLWLAQAAPVAPVAPKAPKAPVAPSASSPSSSSSSSLSSSTASGQDLQNLQDLNEMEEMEDMSDMQNMPGMQGMQHPHNMHGMHHMPKADSGPNQKPAPKKQSDDMSSMPGMQHAPATPPAGSPR